MNMPRVNVKNLSKSFTLHAQGGLNLSVLNDVSLKVDDGECVVLEGSSGQGKSTLLKLIFANYRATSGEIDLKRVDGTSLEILRATAPELLDMREHDVGYVSQFLRVIPRVSALNLVAEPLIDQWRSSKSPDMDKETAISEAQKIAKDWLKRLRIPESLWELPPATFSGGEQQRINIARSLIRPRPLMLLDEPTASLDVANANTVVDMIHDLLKQGHAVLGIFHDESVRERVASRRVSLHRS